MTDVSYIRTEMLPQQAPPLGERGLVKWLRMNLFSSAFNAILTIVAIAVILFLASKLYPWLSNSVWVASSVTECREIVAASAGEGASGACWAVVREWWHQWLFGYYPQDYVLMAQWVFPNDLDAAGGYEAIFGEAASKDAKAAFIAVIEEKDTGFAATMVGYWRPILAFVLLFVALAPVLFERVPKQLLWFTIIYPALCFWLLWGGSVWSPIVAMFGFVLLALVYRMAQPVIGVAPAAGLGVVTAVLWWLIFDAQAVSALSYIAPFGIEPAPSSTFGGFLLAITIGVTAISFSLPFGILLALGRQSDMPLIKYLSIGFIEFIRGVPLITLLFTASLLLMYFMPPGTKFDIILRVIILVTLFAAAYLAEVIRGGLAALPRGQYEAADALGLDYWRAQRLIILPQALKISIPSIVSTFIGLFKDTTLVTFVGLFEPLKGVTTAARADLDWKASYWEPYIFVGAIFFVICFSMSRYSMYLERKLKTDRH
jgi:general L-amino acid transport system permease protein